MIRSCSGIAFPCHRDRRTRTTLRRRVTPISRETEVTFCVRGVISPVLSNIFLHVLDTVWTRKYAHLGVLVRYADDFVVMCDTKAACEQAEQRVREVFVRLGLELHPEKTRRVEL